MYNVNKKIKGNRFKRSKYHILYYTPSYFNPGKEDGEEGKDKKKGSSVKIPVRIDSGEGESRLNVTSFSVKTITHFDNNVEGVLTSLSLLDERIIKPQGIKDYCECTKGRNCYNWFLQKLQHKRCKKRLK